MGWILHLLLVVLISANRDVPGVAFSARDFLINDCIIVKMSVEGDDFVQKPPRTAEMSTTSDHYFIRNVMQGKQSKTIVTILVQGVDSTSLTDQYLIRNVTQDKQSKTKVNILVQGVDSTPLTDQYLIRNVTQGKQSKTKVNILVQGVDSACLTDQYLIQTVTQGKQSKTKVNILVQGVDSTSLTDQWLYVFNHEIFFRTQLTRILNRPFFKI